MLNIDFQEIFSRFKFPFILQVKTKWLEILSVLGSIFSAKLIWVTDIELALFGENNTLQITTLGINNPKTLVHPLNKFTQFIAVRYCIWGRRILAHAE